MRLAVTGHRPEKLGGYDPVAKHTLEMFCVDQLSLLRPVIVLTGMAQGFDQACASACVSLCIPFEACLPCLGQEKLWPRQAQRGYHQLLSAAAKVIQVTGEEYYDGCMSERNEYMVDHSDHLLALWAKSRGGTANCVHYAESVGREWTNCWAEWEGFR